jgi:hypothetical protein
MYLLIMRYGTDLSVVRPPNVQPNIAHHDHVRQVAGMYLCMHDATSDQVNSSRYSYVLAQNKGILGRLLESKENYSILVID